MKNIYDDNLLQIIHTALLKNWLFGSQTTILYRMHFFSFTKSQFLQVYLLRQTGKKVSTLHCHYSIIFRTCLRTFEADNDIPKIFMNVQLQSKNSTFL